VLVGSTIAKRLIAAVCAALVMTAGTRGAERHTQAGTPSIELVVMGPKEVRSSTTREFVNVIGRTSRNATVQVAGVAASVFPTGIFVRDRVPLAMGKNTIRIEARLPGGAPEIREIEVERTLPPAAETPPTDHLYIDAKSIQPQAALRVMPGEPIEVSLRATPGMMVDARLPKGQWLRLDEQTDGASGQPTGTYSGYVAFSERDDTTAAPVQLRLKAAPGRKVSGTRTLDAKSPGTVAVWNPDRVRLFVSAPDGADLTWGLHEVRLGGPNLAELRGGTVLRVTGQRGDAYRVRLASDTEGWVATRLVAPAPAGTQMPYLIFTSLSVSGDTTGDTVVIPYTSPVPYAVRSAEGTDGRAAIDVDIYGAHNAATWITQRATASVVRDTVVEQVAVGHLRVRITLNDRQLWGYKVEQTRTALRLTIRRPPARSGTALSPLQGLTIALEPGHGGESNVGARGPTGSLEKDVNRATVETLKVELERVGARVVVVRPGDENPNLADRARRATEADAHLYISMHANSADTQSGYLRVSGTSTYYKHAFCRELSTAIHHRLLRETGLADFGNVGAFNYTPIRLVTWMPSMLVEQAFMSNPSDESLMLDPAFRARTALAVRLGIEDFLSGR